MDILSKPACNTQVLHSLKIFNAILEKPYTSNELWETTKKLKYSLLKAFFNFIKDSVDLSLINPCDSPILRKIFKVSKGQSWTILDRDVVDEIIFKTDNFRNRLMLELMARGGMRVGEVLKLKAKNVYDRKLFLSDPKSGRQIEIVSKIILRHANLATTQRYLGKVMKGKILWRKETAVNRAIAFDIS
jgi:integrase